MNTENLKLARRKSGMTQQNVADAIGVVQSAYKNYEQGNREPKGNTIVKLADLFGVTTDYLLGRKPATPNNPMEKLGTAIAQAFELTELDAKILAEYLSADEQSRKKIFDYAESFARDKENN